MDSNILVWDKTLHVKFSMPFHDLSSEIYFGKFKIFINDLT